MIIPLIQEHTIQLIIDEGYGMYRNLNKKIKWIEEILDIEFKGRGISIKQILNEKSYFLNKYLNPVGYYGRKDKTALFQ